MPRLQEGVCPDLVLLTEGACEAVLYGSRGGSSWAPWTSIHVFHPLRGALPVTYVHSTNLRYAMS